MLTSIIGFLITIVKLILILGIVATIHEFGHFLFSKMFKIGVDEFSVGFGPLIFQKKYKGTMYSLRCIPLGGYCAIEGEGEASDSDTSFSKKNPVQKILVLVAGALFNAILAFSIFVFIAFLTTSYNTKIVELDENSVLKNAGIQVGDEIYSINGERVKLWTQILNMSVANDNGSVEVEYIRDGKKNSVIVNDAIKTIGYIGVSFVVENDGNSVSNEVSMVASGNSAQEAGIKAGDKIISINGTSTNNSSDIIDIVQKNASNELDFEIQRGTEVIHKTVTPKAKANFDLGISMTQEVKTNLSLAMAYVGANFKNIVGSYVKLFQGEVSVKDMSGIVGIGEVVSKSSGVLEFFDLMAIISLAVGVANVMPFPPLDGGKIVIVLY